MAKIMNLVDPRMLESLPPVNPVHRTLNTLDQDMQAILQRSDLSDADKVRQYNQVLQRYLEYQDRQPTGPPSALPSPRHDLEGDLIHTVPKTMQKKAKALLERIKSHPDMNWNERGEFVYQNRVVGGSNMVDLINDMLRHRKSFQPRGWQAFARALRQTNVPQDMIGHRERWDWMHRESATSDAFSTADESPPIRPQQKKVKKVKKEKVQSEFKWESQ